jgi:hypothetical protein
MDFAMTARFTFSQYMTRFFFIWKHLCLNSDVINMSVLITVCCCFTGTKNKTVVIDMCDCLACVEISDTKAGRTKC